MDYPENITLVIHYVNKDNIDEIFEDNIIENYLQTDILVDTNYLIKNILETIIETVVEISEIKTVIETMIETVVKISEIKTNSIETAEIEIQTNSIETVEIEIQTNSIETAEIEIQTNYVETAEIEIQTNYVETAEIEIQTNSVETVVKKNSVEIEIQTDNISINTIETQTEYLMEKEDIHKILPDILIQNLSHDILLQISKVLSSKKENTSEELEQEYKERERKKEEKILQCINNATEYERVREREKEKEEEEKIEYKVPKIIFVVPYRDREQQYLFFHKQMTKEILAEYPPGSYKIWYIHQCDNRDFNRGAMKNIGFLVAKQQYPNDYKNITLVFNDVDTMPFNRNFIHYETSPGIVKHFYGYDFALGGIVSMNAHDFERINGYPNLWGWGFEDNCLQVRVKKVDFLHIDRGQFYPILDKNILQLTDGVTRIVNRNEFDQYYHNTTEGIYSITDLNYDIDENTGFVNIRNFNTGREQDLGKRKVHDLRKGPAPFNPNDKNDKNRKKTMMRLLF